MSHSGSGRASLPLIVYTGTAELEIFIVAAGCSVAGAGSKISRRCPKLSQKVPGGLARASCNARVGPSRQPWSAGNVLARYRPQQTSGWRPLPHRLRLHLCHRIAALGFESRHRRDPARHAPLRPSLLAAAPVFTRCTPPTSISTLPAPPPAGARPRQPCFSRTSRQHTTNMQHQ
jgi:hypothetical protein